MTSPSVKPESSTVTGKAVSYGGGTGVGAILYKLIETCPNEDLKSILILCIPAVSVAVADFGKYLFSSTKKTVSSFRKRRIIKRRVKDIEVYLQDTDLDDSLREELKDKRNKAITALFDD